MDTPYPLGRLVNHDPRSRAFPARGLSTWFRPKQVRWRHWGPALDQGQVGSCTAEALVQWLNTTPGHQRGTVLHRQPLALELYAAETVLQGGPVYPPADPGGSGLAVCQAAVQAGLITNYTHAFGLDHARAAVALGPLLVGTNWHEAMFTPSVDGFLEAKGPVVGGHEYLCTGYDPRWKVWRFLNSWGPGWAKRGTFYLTEDTFSSLLAAEGDVTVPVL